MKKLFLLCALCAVMLSACREYPKEVYKTKDGLFSVIEVDSCEYIIKYEGYRGFMAHKGNCKYCEERLNEKLKKVK